MPLLSEDSLHLSGAGRRELSYGDGWEWFGILWAYQSSTPGRGGAPLHPQRGWGTLAAGGNRCYRMGNPLHRRGGGATFAMVEGIRLHRVERELLRALVWGAGHTSTAIEMRSGWGATSAPRWVAAKRVPCICDYDAGLNQTQPRSLQASATRVTATM